MYVSPINAMGTKAQLTNSQSNKKSVSFKSYEQRFAEAYKSHPTTRKALSQVYSFLARESLEGKGVQLRKGNQILAWGFDTLEERIEKLAKLANNVIVFKNGKERVSAYGKSIEFKGEDDKYIKFELNSNDSITFSQNNDHEYNIFNFYPHRGNLRQYKHVSGEGLAQSSKTTSYNNDGTVNTFKTFFNRLFGM